MGDANIHELLLHLANEVIAYYNTHDIHPFRETFPATLETKSIEPPTPAEIEATEVAAVPEEEPEKTEEEVPEDIQRILDMKPGSQAVMNPVADRMVELKTKDARLLKRLFLAADNSQTKEGLSALSKNNLVKKIAEFEAITGHRIDEADPNIIETAPVVPDASDDLTDDVLLKLPLPSLKQYALDHGVAAEKMRGLDNESIVALLSATLVQPHGSEPVEEPAEDDDECYSADELKAMSEAELKSLARDNDIPFPRGATREDVLAILLEED